MHFCKPTKEMFVMSTSKMFKLFPLLMQKTNHTQRIPLRACRGVSEREVCQRFDLRHSNQPYTVDQRKSCLTLHDPRSSQKLRYSTGVKKHRNYKNVTG